MTYTDWLKRPESERNPEAATVVMGWMLHESPGACEAYWYQTDRLILTKFSKDFNPCTDRNATDMLLAEVERQGKRDAFDYELGCHSDDVYHAIRSGSGHAGSALGILRIDPSLLTWACVEACKGGAS